MGAPRKTHRTRDAPLRTCSIRAIRPGGAERYDSLSQWRVNEKQVRRIPLSPFLVFGAPKIGEPEIAEVEACLRSDWLGTGPRVAQFERDFADWRGVQPAQVAAGIEPGSEVITTLLTFCATVNAIIHAGLTPVLADADPLTQNIDPNAIETAITPRKRAILRVQFAGRPCAMDRIMAIASKHNLIVIEAWAHAIEKEFHGQNAGTFGDFGCNSFYATKNAVTRRRWHDPRPQRGARRAGTNAGAARNEQGRLAPFQRPGLQALPSR